MVKKLVILIVVIIVSIPLFANDMSPIGKWKTIDDKTGKAKSIVKIWEENKMLYGKIIELFRKPEEEQNPLCEKGEFKGQPILGLTILRDLKKDADSAWWIHGKITDPANGKTYNCKIRTIEEGKKLQVRGYIKVILKIGRSQIWERVITETEEKNKQKEDRIEEKKEIKIKDKNE